MRSNPEHARWHLVDEDHQTMTGQVVALCHRKGLLTRDREDVTCRACMRMIDDHRRQWGSRRPTRVEIRNALIDMADEELAQRPEMSAERRTECLAMAAYLRAEREHERRHAGPWATMQKGEGGTDENG